MCIRDRARVVPVAVLGTRRTGEGVNRIPGMRRRLVVRFGEPFAVERVPGVSGKRALEDANERIRAALSELVVDTVARTGVALPTDDPNRERRAAP